MFSVYSVLSLLKDGLSHYLGFPFMYTPKSKASNAYLNGTAGETGPVYLLGLETFHGLPKTPMNTVSSILARASAMEPERVKKYCDATRVDMGQIAYDVTLPGELERIRDLKLTERFNICEEQSLIMAKETVAALFKSSNVNIQDITHIITCTCTALVNPGLETVIPEHFGLRDDIFSICVNFMGCHAGVKTLALAKDIAQANPGARVLYICAEVCSMQIPAALDVPMDVLVAALFRDGCAAGIVGCSPQAAETPLYELGARYSLRCPNTMDRMTWRMGDDRITFFLARDIPDCVAQGIPKIKQQIPDLNRCRIAIHPGGPAVVFKVAESLRIPPKDFMHSFEVLKERGNMSSTSIFYVFQSMLKEIEADRAAGKHIPDVILMAFGPGLTTEAIRVKVLKQ